MTRVELLERYAAEERDFSGADLCGANLSWANLSRANLGEANLSGAYLSGANLRRTVLDPACPVYLITDEELGASGLEPRGDLVHGWRTCESQHVGTEQYTPHRHPYVAEVFSRDRYTACHPGIYIAGRKWLRAQFPGVRIVRCYCRRDELIHAGNKWRCRRLWVLGEGVRA